MNRRMMLTTVLVGLLGLAQAQNNSTNEEVLSQPTGKTDWIAHTYEIVPDAGHNPAELFQEDKHPYDPGFWDFNAGHKP